MRQTLANEAVTALPRLGIDTVFGIPGVHTLEYYRALAGADLNVVSARHEQGAAFMADGYARAGGRAAAVSVITGPGLTNAATGIGQAWADSVPMLVLTTHNESPGRGQLHELCSQELLARGLSNRYYEPIDGESLHRALAETFAAFRRERPRPAILSIARQQLALSADPQPAPVAESEPPSPADDEISRVVSALAASRRPAIIVGGGCVAAAPNVRALVERLGIPVLTTVAGKGVVPSSSKWCLGSVLPAESVQAWVRDRDLVLALGTELAATDTEGEAELVPGDRMIRADIDAAELADERYPDQLAIRSDAGRFCESLLAALPTKVDPWSNEAVTDASVPWVKPHHREALAALRLATDPETCFVSDMTQIAYAGNVVFPVEEPRLWLHPTGFGSLGFAVPAAIGAAIAGNGRPVVALVGDSGLLYTGQELATAAELGLPLTVVVWNNHALGQIRDDMARASIPLVSVHPHNGDVQALARAYDCASERVQSPAGLADAVARAQDREPGPTVVDATVEDAAPS